MASKPKVSNQNIQVFARVRPTNALERMSRSVVEVKSDREISVKDSKQNNTFKKFTFNNVFGPNSAQIDVYRAVVAPLIDEVLSGYNCTVFAYGQTGTGKTFTMEGERSPNSNTMSWENDPLAGIVPRTLSQLFDELRLLQVDFCVKVSFLELYNEELFDLLSPAEDTTKLRIFEDSNKKGAVIIHGLEEVSVQSKADVYQILEKGSLKRQTAETLMNAHSSRSHTVFTVTVHIRESANEGEEFMRTGKMNLVDLAGSENIGRSGAVDKRAREAGNINQSLLTLGRVITALVDHSPHIPYRESKLTRILQESLGGRTKTSIIATVSPAACNLEETLSTLEYAHRAKNIQNKPEINQKLCKKTLLKEYSEEIERLQRDLEATQQRSGIYLDQFEYDNMTGMLDQLQTEIKSKEQEIMALTEQYEKRKAILDELCSEVEVVKKEVRERSDIKDAREKELSSLRTKKTEIVKDTAEKDYLTMCHLETLQSLSDQASSLHQTSVECTQNAELLFDKVERTRVASERNQMSIEEFNRRNNELIDGLLSSLNLKVCLVTDRVASVSALTKKSFNALEDHSNETVVAARNLSKVDELIMSFKSEFDAVVNNDSELLDSLEESARNFLDSISIIDYDLKATFEEDMCLAVDVKEKFEHHMDKANTKLSLDLEKVNEDVSQWADKGLAQFNSTLQPISESLDAACATLEYTVAKEDLYEEVLKIQQEKRDKFDSLRQMISDLGLLDEKERVLVDKFAKLAEDNVSSVKSKMSEVHTLSETSLKSQLVIMESAQTALEKNLDQIPKHVENEINELQLTPEFITEDVKCELVARRDSAVDFFKSNLEDHFCKRSKQYEKFESSSNITTQSILDVTNSTGRDIDYHMSEQVSALECLKTGIKSITSELHGTLDELTTELSQKTHEYEDAVEYVETFGAKPATPTGKTPQRSELHIQRDIAATSPHERILARLRSRYRIISQMSPKKSASPQSEADSDASQLDNDVIGNKENPIIETPDKSVNSKLHVERKGRKPLSGSN
ncbi:Kinesin-like protein KIF11-A [Frankliniella fusca]|uniref:Kinesin-like protein KIF11-A n=1 Tax=Frankliniella fusca TaxID=407009 RepID=A0AAE1LVZ8_9NEOP|nr:Kinesin-like protein KIF11-A [Frankliniella fusca]